MPLAVYLNYLLSWFSRESFWSRPRIEPPSQITANIFLGNYLQASQALNHGITYVLNCCAGSVSSQYNKQEGVDYLDLAMRDSPYYYIEQHFEETKKFIDNAIANNAKILIHCHAGVSRSATIVIAYLMATDLRFGGSLLSTYEYVKSGRSKICPNLGFMIALSNFQTSVQEKFRQEEYSTGALMAQSLRLQQTELRLFKNQELTQDPRPSTMAVVPYTTRKL